MATEIGKMDQRIRIEAPSEPRDTRGQVKQQWQPVAELWGGIEPVGGGELWQAKTVQSEATELVTIWYREDVERSGPKWRVVVVTQWNRVLNVVAVRRDGAAKLVLECKGEGRSA